MPTDLPIHAVLPDLLAALRAGNGAVLVAPPGAGKTTCVAPALLDQQWCTGQVILLSPRRIAARAAAERMAEMLGEQAGETVGYLTRLDSKTSKATRILVMTEAIFVSRILGDQELEGISAVLFDEAHERHLDSDLGLALALETQSVLRDDLRLLAMSATIDGARFARLLGEKAEVIESEGRAFSLDIRYLGAAPEKRVEEAMISAVLTAWREQSGNLLAFLPGVGEIERVRERLADRLPDVPILPLHGQVQPADQRAAIRRDAVGRRRIVLATSIAETSITLDGVTIVVDSGLSRRAEYDVAAGVTHLATRIASRAASAQRAGRAARQGPGVAYRLWEEPGHAGRPEFDPPEIVNADLAPLVLSLAKWGVTDPASLHWLDPPPEAAILAARERLGALGALDESGAITAWGEKVAAMPLDPAGAATILFGAEQGQARDAARLVLLTQERGLGGRGEDLAQRLQRWNGERGSRAEAARKLAERWARQADALLHTSDYGPRDPALFLARARSDFIARRRDASGEHWLSAGGRGFRLDPASSLARAEWLVIADAQGQAKGARITSAIEIARADIERHLLPLIEERRTVRWNGSENRVEARRERRLGAITLASGPDPDPDPQALADILVEKSVERLGGLLPAALLARARFAGVAALSVEALAERAGEWLAPLLTGRRDLDLPPGHYAQAALNLLGWDERQALDQRAPREFASPAGTRHAIEYAGDDAPSVEVRVQAVFGLDRHPMIGETPLLLKLTDPGGKPMQATRDLPGFWRGSWKDVQKDGRGRYPKHRWPDEPWAEKPSLKTKNAFKSAAD